MGIAEALDQVHFPDDFERRDAALRRLAFDELLALQVGMVGRRRERAVAAALSVTIADGRDAAIRAALAGALGALIGRPAELTADQEAAMEAVRQDVAGRHPMLRLLQGDVGSGKTAVAAYALALAAEAGVQGALLAPTDLLARQHAVTLDDLLAPLGIPVTLLTGSLSGPGAAAALEALADGRAAVVVGTHALFSERVRYARLGLVVVDEQHRFGVEQRGALEAKTTGGAAHVLLMTATPIPRTIGQVLYADLDVTDLRTVPAGRLPIRTTIRRPDDLDRLWRFVRGRRRRGDGRSSWSPTSTRPPTTRRESVAAAEAEAERLRALLSPLRVGLVHGRMKAAARDAAMARFRDGGLDVLVGHDRRRGRGRRARGDGDGHRGRRPLRAGPAPPAARPRRARRPAASYCVLVADVDGRHARPPSALAAVAADDRRVRARRDGLRAAPRGRRAGLRPERPAAPAGRDARAPAITASSRSAARRHAEGLLDGQGGLPGGRRCPSRQSSPGLAGATSSPASRPRGPDGWRRPAA